MNENGPLKVGIGGPVGSGKTALMEKLCIFFRNKYFSYFFYQFFS